MKFLTVCLVFAILGLSLSAVTPTAASFTTSAFNSTPSKVFDAANATAASGMTQKDSTAAWITVGYASILFTAGNTTNDTIYGFGTVYTTAFVVSSVVKRTINATIAAWGNDTTEAAVSVIDASTTLSFTGKGALKFAAGGGYYAIAAVSAASTSTNPDILQVFLINGASSTSVTTRSIVAGTATTVTNTVSGSTSTTTTTNTFAVDSIWNEDGYFYVLYETQTTVVICSGSACGTAVSTTYTSTGLLLQAFSVSSTTNLYSSPIAVSGTLTETATINVAATAAIGAGSNSTQSTYILVQWKQTVSSASNLYATVLKRADGSVQTAAASIVADTTTVVNQPGGFISSNYTYGLIYTTRTGSSTYTYTQSALYNGTLTASSAVALSNISVSSALAYPSFNGFRYTTGFGIVAAIQTVSSPVTIQYVLGSFFANATFNGTSATTLGTNVGVANGFTDINGAVWFAYSTYDSGSSAPYTPYTSYVAKLVGSVNNAMAATTTGANVLATFAALVSFVVLSLFVF